MIENATPYVIQALHSQSRRAEQTLRNRGTVPSGLEGPNYPDVEVDAAVQGFIDQAISIGYDGGSTPLPPTSVVVNDGEALPIPVTGTYASTATFTVVDGAITGIELS